MFQLGVFQPLKHCLHMCLLICCVIFMFDLLFLHCILLLVLAEFLSYVAKSIRYTLASRKNCFLVIVFSMIDFTTIHDWSIFIYHESRIFCRQLILFLHWILEAFFVFICRLEVENCKH
jgi:hypothetical protein